MPTHKRARVTMKKNNFMDYVRNNERTRFYGKSDEVVNNVNCVRTVEAPWICEMIIEKFGSSPLNLMGDKALIYGGSIRDAMAGLDVVGDLDIAVTRDVFRRVSRSFKRSVQWTLVKTLNLKRPKRIKEVDYVGDKTAIEEQKEDGLKEDKFHGLRSFIKGYVENIEDKYPRSNKNVEYVERFKGVNSTMDLICTDVITIKELINLIIGKVDFACCGFAMYNNGVIKEVVEGAEEDCKNKVLRIHDVDNVHSVQLLMERVEKLCSRGWKEPNNLKEIIDTVTKREIDYKKQLTTRKTERRLSEFKEKRVDHWLKLSKASTRPEYRGVKMFEDEDEEGA